MVQIANPFQNFSPKNKGPGLFAGLDAWAPLKRYNDKNQELAGNVSWNGPELTPISTKTNTPPTPPLEKIFGDLLQRIWVKGNAPTASPQRNLLAQTRQQRPGMPAPAPYRPMVAPTISAAMPQPMPHLTGLANDWGLYKQLQRFTGYAFRGDSRDPAAIKAAGGFQPSAARTDDHFIKGAVYEQFTNYMQRRFQKDMKSMVTPDQFLDIVRQSAKSPDDREAFQFFTNWRAIVKSEELHMGRMLAEEALKGYISTTKAVTVAKGFAKKSARGGTGWVYCVAVLGGFIVPERGTTAWTQIFGEQEIAKAGNIPWHSVAAARAVKPNGMFEGDIHIYKGFDKIDPKAFEEIFKLLSGKPQQ